jgi:excisionase family DNA binding protein
MTLPEEIMNWLRVEDVGDRLGVRTREVYDLIDQGQLPAYRDEQGRIVIAPADVDSYRQNKQRS